MVKLISVIKLLNTLFVLQIGKVLYLKAKIKKGHAGMSFFISLKIIFADGESISL